MGTFDAGHADDGDAGQRSRRTVHGPVVGYATVNGERVAISSKRSSYGKDVARPALLPPPVQRPGALTAESFMKAASLSRRRRSTRSTSTKATSRCTPAGRAAAPQPRTSTRACRPSAPASTSGTGFLAKAGHPQGIDPRDGTITNWNQTAAKGFAAADDEWGHNGSVARIDLLRQEPRSPRDQEGQVDARLGDRGDERRRHPGRARDRHGAAAQAPAEGLQGPERAGAADARRCWSRGSATAAAAWTATSTATSTIRAPRSWTAPGTTIADAFMAPKLGSQLDELRLAVQPLRPAAQRPVQRLVSVLRPRRPDAARQEGQVAVQLTPTAATAS